MAKGEKDKEAEKEKPKEQPENKVNEEQKASPQKQHQAETKTPGAGKKRVDVSDSTPAQVIKVFGKTGLTGECYQVMARILAGPDKGNLLRRNVIGPVRENDILMLKETERDVRSI